MTAEDVVAGGGAGLPSSGDIRTLSGQIGAVHRALRRDRILITILAVVIIGLGAWCAVQQVRLNDQASVGARQDHTIAQLAERNAGDARRDAGFARSNCEAGNRYKAGIRAAFADYAAIVSYKSAADRAKAPAVAAEVRAATTPRDCSVLSLKNARRGF